MSADSPYHAPVLLAEIVTLFSGAQTVVDGTLGGGGHSSAFLERGLRVVGIDRDPEARAEAGARLREYVDSGQLRILDSTFADAVDHPAIAGEQFDAVLLDLGISSHQIDDPTRGFTFREGAALDMRMAGSGPTAADWLNTTDADSMATAFREYADEQRSRKLAQVIARRRDHRPFSTSDDFVGAIRETLGARSGTPDFARLFQAVRIAVNDEMDQLARALVGWRDRLAPGGVLAVIAYHSGEDRLVKHAFQQWSQACICPPLQPRCICGQVAPGTTLTRKPVEASAEETARNVRARSAKLRAWRRREQAE
jgi:16S rRNA (cytosine1402-N4)-methyltransferase